MSWHNINLMMNFLTNFSEIMKLKDEFKKYFWNYLRLHVNPKIFIIYKLYINFEWQP